MRVWAFKRTRVLDGRTGFVDVPDVLAAKLIADGYAAAKFDALLARDPPHAPFADDVKPEPPFKDSRPGKRGTPTHRRKGTR